MKHPQPPTISRALSYPELLNEQPSQTLIISNEIASPLYGPDYDEGDFGKFTHRLARKLAAHGIGVYAHERLGSADMSYNSHTAKRLSPPNRQETIRHEARKIATDIHRIFPATEQISLLGHSAGAVESIDLARAFHEDEKAASLLGKITVGHLVAFDPPRHRHWWSANGIARYLAYLPYEAILPTPPKGHGEQDSATAGALRRFITDTRYNAATWAQGVAPNLSYVARQMPQTAIYVAVARHSPNNIAHLYGSEYHANNIRQLRDGMPPDVAVCDAQVYPGPHAGGSRKSVILGALAEAGVISSSHV